MAPDSVPMQVATVSGDQFGLKAQAREVFADPHQAFGFQIDTQYMGQLGLGFQQMAGLAAGCAAGIQYALAGGQLQQVGGQLRGLVLDTDMPGSEARQAGDIAGLGQHDAVVAVGARAGGNVGGG